MRMPEKITVTERKKETEVNTELLLFKEEVKQSIKFSKAKLYNKLEIFIDI